MATFRFLHCADLHLDSPLRGLEADPDSPVEKIRGATREALKNLIDYAIEQQIDFVVAAGDLYDGDWQDWGTGHFLIGQIARLSNAGIPFIAIRGNHDAESVITRRLRMPGDNARMLDHRKPETWRLPNVPVSIHGQSFATKAVTENIARAYPRPDPDRFNIGLLHSSVGEREGHDTYASCPVEQLRDHGYEYWALGHIHKGEVLSRDPWIVFPGNIQGRHINETGPKGASLVTVTDGAVVGVAPVCFDVVRWARISIALGNETGEEMALAQIRAALAEAYQQASGRLLAVRIALSGACLAHDSFARNPGAVREKIIGEALAVAGPGMIWVETVEVDTKPMNRADAQAERSDAIGQLVRAIEEVGSDVVLDDVRDYAATMLERSPPLRAAIGDGHAAAKLAGGTLPDDLRQRARDLLLRLLDE
jgi:DNA repair exonuclease SbcCD nuclease subunit